MELTRWGHPIIEPALTAGDQRGMPLGTGRAWWGQQCPGGLVEPGGATMPWGTGRAWWGQQCPGGLVEPGWGNNALGDW